MRKNCFSNKFGNSLKREEIRIKIQFYFILDKQIHKEFKQKPHQYQK